MTRRKYILLSYFLSMLCLSLIITEAEDIDKCLIQNTGEMEFYLYPPIDPDLSFFPENNLVAAIPTPSGGPVSISSIFPLDFHLSSMSGVNVEELLYALQMLDIRSIFLACKIDSAFIEKLEYLKNLERITISGQIISGNTVKWLNKMPNLTILDLIDCLFEDIDCMTALSESEIYELQLKGCSAAKLDWLRSLPKIKNLIIDDSILPNEEFLAIEALTNLEKLFIVSDKINDEGISWIAKLSKLKTISLNCPLVTGRIFTYLSNSIIEELYIDSVTRVTENIKSIFEAGNLKVVSLINTDISDEDLKALEGEERIRKLVLINNTKNTKDVFGWINAQMSPTYCQLGLTKSQNIFYMINMFGISVFKCKSRLFDSNACATISSIRSIQCLSLSGPVADQGFLYFEKYKTLSSYLELELIDTELGSELGDDVLTSISNCMNLRCLSIQNLNISTDAWLDELKKLGHLEILKLINVSCLKSSTMVKLVEFPSLKIIDLSKNPQLSREDMAILAKKAGLIKVVH